MAMTSAQQVGASALDLIGNTPLIRLEKVAAELPTGVTLAAKAEWLNPGGSVKDRPALAMIRDGIARGVLTPQKTILEATSGNTGIALAMIGAALGYRVELCLPENASPERKRILQRLWRDDDPDRPACRGAMARSARRGGATPPTPSATSTPTNTATTPTGGHTTRRPRRRSGRRRAAQVTHFVAGLGTSGTFMGTGRRLREYNPAIRLIAMQPDSPYHGLEGLKHMASAIVPPIYDADVRR